MINWKWLAFEDFSASDLYELMRLRQQVFIVEQQCIYEDIDNRDQIASHLVGRVDNDGPICAYLRVFSQGVKFDEIAFGRVLTAPEARGTGLGKELISQALVYINEQYPGQACKISAQVYLERFYADFGFSAISAPYDEDGIMHIDMIKN